MVPTRGKVDLKGTFTEEGVGETIVFIGSIKNFERQNDSLDFNIFLCNVYERLIHKNTQTYNIKSFLIGGELMPFYPSNRRTRQFPPTYSRSFGHSI